MKRQKRIFILKIDVPVILAFVFFSGLIFFYLIPGFEKTMMEQKRKLIHEITSSANSLLGYYHSLEEGGLLTSDEAKGQAMSAVSMIRYGETSKDYFWITDTMPRMIIHPYRPDLNGADLTEYRDSNGKQVFVEFVKAVRSKDESYVDYMWQWNDDTTRTVPKLSYVSLFKPWGWIVGTGIYIEDVRTEIARIERSALVISGSIGLLIIILLVIITTQSHRIEQKRESTAEELLKSRELYRTLAEANSEGVLIWSGFGLQGNKTLLSWLGYTEEELKNISPEKILSTTDPDSFSDLDSLAIEAENIKYAEMSLKARDGSIINAHADLSTIQMGGTKALLVVLRPSRTPAGEISVSLPAFLLKEINTGFFRTGYGRKFRFIYVSARTAEILGHETPQDLLMHNLESYFVYNYEFEYFRSVNGTCSSFRFRDALLRKNDGTEFVANLGIVSDLTGDEPVCEGSIDVSEHTRDDYFSLPVASMFQKGTAAIQALDEADKTSPEQFFVESREVAASMIRGGADPSSVTLFFSTASDEICKKIVETCTEEAGPPPCRFAFILTGSAGRMEQSLSTDQDNAIIFEDCSGDKLKMASDYFTELGKRINSMLDLAGFRYCKGLNMAGNPKWTQPLGIWKEYFSGWIRNPGPQQLLDICIYFDFRFCTGDNKLAEELHAFVKKDLGTNDIFFHHMVAAMKTFAPSLNKAQAGNTDIKKILMPLTGIIRLYALKHGIEGYSTMERIAMLQSKNHLDPGLMRVAARAWKELTEIRLSHQASCLDEGREPDNIIDLDNADDCRKAGFGQAVSEVKNLMLKAGTDFFTDIV
jgi:PAS domain S-box-containing protein